MARVKLKLKRPITELDVDIDDVQGNKLIKNTIDWTLVTDKLPIEQENVLVSICDESGDTKWRYTDVGWFMWRGSVGSEPLWIVDRDVNNYVIAWAPLPEPYQ